MRMRKVAVAFAAIIFFPAFVAAAPCDASKFGARKVKSCAIAECHLDTPPLEIAQIKRGLYVAEIGYSENAGNAYWIGVDFESGKLTTVNAYSGLAADPIRLPKAENDSLYSRQRTDSGVKSIEVVERISIEKFQLDALACTANSLWIKTGPVIRYSTDVINFLYLVDSGKVKVIGGFGSLDGLAGKISEQLEQLRTMHSPHY